MRVVKFEAGEIKFEDSNLFEEMSKDTSDVLEKYNSKFQKIDFNNGSNETILNCVVEDINKLKVLYNNANEDDYLISNHTDNNVYDRDININKEKGESEDMEVKEEMLDNEVVDKKEEKAPEDSKEVKEEKAECEAKMEDEKAECQNAECKEEEKCEKAECEDVKEACGEKMESEDSKEDEPEEEEMSKIDRKSYEARIATLEQNIKSLKSKANLFETYKAKYEEALSTIKSLEDYKENNELDKLRRDKDAYAHSCNYESLEDEDKDEVQKEIDNFKFSLYDFKAFMADILKKYSRKQVYSNLEKVINYFSIDDVKPETMEIPTDKSMTDKVLDKYSDLDI